MSFLRRGSSGPFKLESPSVVVAVDDPVPSTIVASGNLFSRIGNVVGVVGAAAVFVAAAILSAPAPASPAPQTIVAAPQGELHQPAPRLFGPHPFEVTPLVSALTARPQADPTGPQPQLIGPVPREVVPLAGALTAKPQTDPSVLAPQVIGQTPREPVPLHATAVAAPQSDPSQQPARLSSAQPPSFDAPPGRPGIVATPQTDSTQPRAAITGQLPFGPVPLAPTSFVAPQVDGSVPQPQLTGPRPPSFDSPLPGSVKTEQQPERQRAPALFGTQPLEITPLVPIRFSAGQREGDRFAAVFSAPPVVAPVVTDRPPPLIVASPQLEPERAPVVSKSTVYPDQPILQEPWFGGATQRAPHLQGRATVFQPFPTSVVADTVPLRQIIAAPAQQLDQPSAEIIGQAPREATPLGPTNNWRPQIDASVPAPSIFGTKPPSLDAPIPGRVGTAEQAEAQRQAVVFGTKPSQATPLGPTALTSGQAERDRTPVIFRQPSPSLDSPQPSTVSTIGQVERDRAALVVGQTPPSYDLPPARPSLVAAPQERRDVAPTLFAPFFKPADVVQTPLTLAAPQPDLTQPAPRLAGQLPFGPVPLRPATVAAPQTDPSQLAARVYAQVPPSLDSVSIAGYVRTDAQPERERTPLVFGTTPPSYDQPPNRSIVSAAPVLGVQPAAVVFGATPPSLDRTFGLVAATPQQDPTQLPPVVIGSALLPSANYPPLTSTRQYVPQRDPTQLPAVVIGSPLLPSAVAPPLRPAIVRNPTDYESLNPLPALVYGSPLLPSVERPPEPPVVSEEMDGGFYFLPPARSVRFACRSQQQVVAQSRAVATTVADSGIALSVSTRQDLFLYAKDGGRVALTDSALEVSAVTKQRITAAERATAGMIVEARMNPQVLEAGCFTKAIAETAVSVRGTSKVLFKAETCANLESAGYLLASFTKVDVVSDTGGITKMAAIAVCRGSSTLVKCSTASVVRDTELDDFAAFVQRLDLES